MSKKKEVEKQQEKKVIKLKLGLLSKLHLKMGVEICQEKMMVLIH